MWVRAELIYSLFSPVYTATSIRYRRQNALCHRGPTPNSFWLAPLKFVNNPLTLCLIKESTGYGLLTNFKGANQHELGLVPQWHKGKIPVCLFYTLLRLLCTAWTMYFLLVNKLPRFGTRQKLSIWISPCWPVENFTPPLHHNAPTWTSCG